MSSLAYKPALQPLSQRPGWERPAALKEPLARQKGTDNLELRFCKNLRGKTVLEVVAVQRVLSTFTTRIS